MSASTKEQRQAHVDQSNATMQEAGYEPDAVVLELQRRYIAGEITARDLLDWFTASIRQSRREIGQDVPTPKDAH